MFRCSVCKTVVGPNVKPTMTTAAIRPVEYTNTRIVLDEYEREQKETVRSVGTEIVSQERCCPKCAGVEEEAPTPLPERLKRIFRNKPFEEKLPEPLRPKVLALAIHNALDRINHNTRRAGKEGTATVETIKGVVERNPKLVF